MNQRLKFVLSKPREHLEIEDKREQERDDDEKNYMRDSDCGEGHSF